MDTVDKIDKKLIDHIIRWLNANIDDGHTLIGEDTEDLLARRYVAEDSQDLKEKIELYMEGMDEFG